MPLTLKPEAVGEWLGREVGVSDWLTIDQARVDAFAATTGDHQFIHVDPERAAATPFGGTIAHGFLTLSLLSAFAAEAGLVFDNTVMAVNYGFDRVRFLTPVRVGRQVRARFRLLEVQARAAQQFLVRQEVTIEIEGEEKPALVAEWLALFFTA